MIRGFYRDRIMSSRPAGLGDRYNRSMSGMSTKSMRMDAAQAEQDAAAGAERARADVTERVYHPAIKAPEHKCFRVVRRWKNEEYGEDIGYRRTQGEALILMNRELGWARVVNPNGKPIAFNGQPMTEKPR